MMYISDFAPQVSAAIDSVIAVSGIKNNTALARRLDVSKQALSKWKLSGIVPAHRALQMELITKGEVSWKNLCPDIVSEFENSTGVVYDSTRKS